MNYNGIATTRHGTGRVVGFRANWVQVHIDGVGLCEYDAWEVEVAPVAHIAIEVHICAQRRSHVVRFFGPQAAQHAIAYLTPKGATHAWSEVFEEPIDYDRYPAMAEFLHPTCEHGMDARSCMGPEHFMSREQELARGWG